MITRRRVVIALGAGALASFDSFAQAQTRPRLIGWLWQGDSADPTYSQYQDAFKVGLRELGYAEGKHYLIETRSAQYDKSRLPALAAELVALKVDLIITSGTPSALAASKATRELPILTTTSADPVGVGLAASLSHPRGNVTGLSNLGAELYAKRLDLLRQVVPTMRRAGFIFDPDDDQNQLSLRRFEAACDKLKLKFVRAPVRNANEMVAAFQTLSREKAGGLVVTNDATVQKLREMIIEQAAKSRLAAVYSNSAFAEAGGFTSYAANTADIYRRAAAYADKIFKGTKPGDLPIEQPTRFEFVLNMKTARALGLKILNSILVQVTKVIE